MMKVACVGILVADAIVEKVSEYPEKGIMEAREAGIGEIIMKIALLASYNPLKELTLNLSGTYTGKMLIEHHAGMIQQNITEQTPSFWDMGCKVSYDFKIRCV